MSGNVVELSKEDKTVDEATKERLRILTLLLSKQADMVQEYKILTRHTGSLVSSSMGYAYSKAFNDIFKLITKETK